MKVSTKIQQRGHRVLAWVSRAAYVLALAWASALAFPSTAGAQTFPPGYVPTIDPHTLPPIDYVLVLDSSGSVGSDGWKDQKEAYKAVLDYWNPRPNIDRFSLVKFGTKASLVLPWPDSDGLTTSQYKNIINDQTYSQGATNIAGGLARAAQFLAQSQGSDPQRNALKIVNVVTDGHQNTEGSQADNAQVLQASADFLWNSDSFWNGYTPVVGIHGFGTALDDQGNAIFDIKQNEFDVITNGNKDLQFFSDLPSDMAPEALAKFDTELRIAASTTVIPEPGVPTLLLLTLLSGLLRRRRRSKV